jgi:NAD+ kinase
VATPTGSTAYSLSAGGPVVRPTVEGLLATPICPHALAFRPLLIGADESVRIRLRGVGVRSRITLDGQVSRLVGPGDEVLIRRARAAVDLITLERESFYDVLRQKLAWAESPRGTNPRR